MSQEELLAFGPGSHLLSTGASHKLLATNNLFASTIARNDEGLSCRHHNHQMIHTIANPVNFLLFTRYSRRATASNDSEYRFGTLEDYLERSKGTPGKETGEIRTGSSRRRLISPKDSH